MFNYLVPQCSSEQRRWKPIVIDQIDYVRVSPGKSEERWHRNAPTIYPHDVAVDYGISRMINAVLSRHGKMARRSAVVRS